MTDMKKLVQNKNIQKLKAFFSSQWTCQATNFSYSNVIPEPAGAVWSKEVGVDQPM
jgi:hypothetical protein